MSRSIPQSKTKVNGCVEGKQASTRAQWSFGRFEAVLHHCVAGQAQQLAHCMTWLDTADDGEM